MKVAVSTLFSLHSFEIGTLKLISLKSKQFFAWYLFTCDVVLVSIDISCFCTKDLQGVVIHLMYQKNIGHDAAHQLFPRVSSRTLSLPCTEVTDMLSQDLRPPWSSAPELKPVCKGSADPTGQTVDNVRLLLGNLELQMLLYRDGQRPRDQGLWKLWKARLGTFSTTHLLAVADWQSLGSDFCHSWQIYRWQCCSFAA